MHSILASGTTVVVGILLSFFCVDKVCLLHEAYILQHDKIQKEAWLREQCSDPVFFMNMASHTNVCEEIEASARIGALWFALNRVSESLPVSQLSDALLHMTWPVCVCVAVLILVFPSLIIHHLRTASSSRLPVYAPHHKSLEA